MQKNFNNIFPDSVKKRRV